MALWSHRKGSQYLEHALREARSPSSLLPFPHLLACHHHLSAYSAEWHKTVTAAQLSASSPQVEVVRFEDSTALYSVRRILRSEQALQTAVKALSFLDAAWSQRRIARKSGTRVREEQLPLLGHRRVATMNKVNVMQKV